MGKQNFVAYRKRGVNSASFAHDTLVGAWRISVTSKLI